MKTQGLVIVILLLTAVLLIFLSQKGKIQGPQDRRAVVALDAPEFVINNENDGVIKLSDLKGKTVFVHFWASWCKECKEELPGIQALYNRKKTDPNFVFLSVIFREDPSITKKYMNENNYDFPVFIDPEYKAAKTYGLTGVPETFIIDTDGILQKRIIGPWKWENI